MTVHKIIKTMPKSGMTNCNICGSTKFTKGPNSRLSKNGKLPACLGCNSMERHRLIRMLWEHLPIGFLRKNGALQFSFDPSTEEKWFSDFELSIYGKSNSLDLQNIDRNSEEYDIVICNHVLEHVEHDIKAFSELVRVCKKTGFVQISVPSPKARENNVDWGFPKEEQHGHYRIYGRNFIHNFDKAVDDLNILEIDSFDPITLDDDYTYFITKDTMLLEKMKFWLSQDF